MYYQECENLANEYPDIAELIKKIDEDLNRIAPDSIMRPEIIAKKYRKKESQVSGIFEMFVKYGILHKEMMIECSNCENLNVLNEFEIAVFDGDEFNCTQCASDMTKQKCDEVEVFRLSGVAERTISSQAINKEEDNLQMEYNEKLPAFFEKDVFKRTPLLQYYSKKQELTKAKPFAGKRALILLHFLRDLIPFMEAMFKLGLQPTKTTLFYKHYPYPQRKAVEEWLEKCGCQVMDVSVKDSYLDKLNKEKNKVGELIIIEDGGLIVPVLHRKFAKLLKHITGCVEQTTRGIMNAEDLKKEINIPILSIPSSRLKAEFEPRYIAKAVVENISTLLHDISFHGKEVCILGYGSIGKDLAHRMMSNGANVTVFDKDAEKALLAQQKGGIRYANSAREAVKDKYLIIGASGRQSIDSSVISELKHNTYLVSASSEQYEIDREELYARAREAEDLLGGKANLIGTKYTLTPDDRQINLLANGYPINFWGMNSMPDQASDLILSLILLSAVEIAKGTYTKNGIDRNAVNEIANEKYNLAEKYLQIHKSSI